MKNGADSTTRGYSLRLLLDEDSQARRLVELLRARDHDVLTVGESNRAGAPDRVVLDMATGAHRFLLTRNCADYLALHEQGIAHSGILCIEGRSDRIIFELLQLRRQIRILGHGESTDACTEPLVPLGGEEGNQSNAPVRFTLVGASEAVGAIIDDLNAFVLIEGEYRVEIRRQPKGILSNDSPCP